MPPGNLGAVTSLVFVLVFLIRYFFITRIIEMSTILDQPKKQFFVEYALVLLAGVLIIFLNRVIFSIPLMNGIVFFIGFISFGFFIAIDMSLKKEREVIEYALKKMKEKIKETAEKKPGLINVPRKFYPMTRKFFIIALAANLQVMVIIMLMIARDLSWLAGMESANMSIMMEMTTRTIFKEISFVVVVLLALVINVLYAYSKNMKLLFQTETGVLESVSNGDLSMLVPVATSDEFGVIATYTNKMIHGLRDRIRILTRLNVAKEVQKNLLPNKVPDFPDMDISGISRYCEEVGGDYFDYFTFSDKRIGIAVTDSSGHGVGAGLHMTTIRAFLRYGAQNYKGAKNLLQTVNRHLTKDSFETGRFTTVFFAEIDRNKHIIKWVRAGHEPGLFYSPSSGEFQKLLGKGMALGVDDTARIEEYEIQGWEKGSILVILTDGLKESRNSQGEMYGEKRITDVIKKQSATSAKEIEEALMEDLRHFCREEPVDDDITVVIVKFL